MKPPVIRTVEAKDFQRPEGDLKPGNSSIEFIEDTREERVHPFNFEDPGNPNSNERFDVLHKKGSRLENISYASAIYWINRGVARILKADPDEKAKFVKDQQRKGVLAAGAIAKAVTNGVPGLTPPPGQ